DNDEFRILRTCLAALAGCRALVGDAAGAREWLARADRRPAETNRICEPWIDVDRAWGNAAEGRVSDAVELARQAAGRARDTSQPVFEALALYLCARLGAAPSVRTRIHTIASTVDSPFVAGLDLAATGLARDDVPALRQASAVLSDHGQPLLAAETAVAA